jgi:hypothetical protein
MNDTRPTPPPPIKGSWEDLYEHGQRHARNFNDEAIPLLRRVFEGLRKLPPAALNAREQRLYNLMMSAGMDLQGFFAVSDRFAEAVTALEEVEALATEEDRPPFTTHKLGLRILAGQTDDVIADLRAQLAAPTVTTLNWLRLLDVLEREKRNAELHQAITDAEAWAQERIAKGTLPDEDILEFPASLSRLRVSLLLDEGRTDEALALADSLIPQAVFTDFPQIIYSKLVRAKRYDQALTYINQDTQHLTRARFWRGLSYWRKGETARARRTWTDALADSKAVQQQTTIFETLLTRIYLGDEDGETLELLLRVQREAEISSWLIQFLTALAWIVREDYSSATVNLRFAVANLKSMGSGRRMPAQYWEFLCDLTPAAEQRRFADFFDHDEAA